MRRKSFLYIVFLAGLAFLFSCEEEQVENNNANLNESFYELMNEMYLWYQEIPEITPSNYENPREVLEEIRYEKDRWSYITSYSSFVQYYQEGAYVGYGFGTKWDATDTLRVSFVFDASPLNEKQITRGWAITEVNGQAPEPGDNINELLGQSQVGVENQIVFESPGGRLVDTTMAKEELTMNTVLTDTVIQHAGSHVGYFALKSFIDKTPDELTRVFDRFAGENIDELVVDLRYNGGGTMEGSRFMAEFIVNDSREGEPFVKVTHNDKKSGMDTTHVFGKDSLDLSLGLERVYFIATQATASSSEALINGLEPYMDVYIIGQDTYGKPVGMYAYSDNSYRYAFVPVCFRLQNAEGNGDYFQGLPADVDAPDDLRHVFGNPQEASLHQALYHIENGAFDQTKAGVRSLPANRVDYNSLQDEIGAH